MTGRRVSAVRGRRERVRTEWGGGRGREGVEEGMDNQTKC